MKLQLREPSWAEKRDSLRLELEFPVSYRTISSTLGLIKKKSKPMNGMMRKPSTRGLRLLTAAAIPAGTTVQITLDMTRLGLDRSYEILGDVVWTDHSTKTDGFEQGIALRKSGPDTTHWQAYIMDCLRRSDQVWRGI